MTENDCLEAFTKKWQKQAEKLMCACISKASHLTYM